MLPKNTLSLLWSSSEQATKQIKSATKMGQNEKAPWLENKDWKDNQIPSNAKFGMYFIWGFALIWNLISLPIFLTNDIWADEQNDPVKAVVYFFPVVGIVLIGVSIRAFVNWRKFGRTPLQLDPFPGSLGRHVGGKILNNIAYDGSKKYLVTLSCLHSYMSGSGKDRSRRESVHWQSEGTCFSEPAANGTEVSFRFSVPADLPQTDNKKASSYYLWRVRINCEFPGADFERIFEIPVFHGLRDSQYLHKSTEDYHLTVDDAQDGLYEIASLTTFPGGLDIFFPALIRPKSGVMACIFGAIFAAAGVFMWNAESCPIIFPLVFTPIGLLIMGVGIWDLSKSLRVRLDRNKIKTRRFLFGYPLSTNTLSNISICKIEIREGSKMTQGNKTTVFYKLLVHSNDGQKLTVAERLSSKPEVQLLKEMIEQYCPNALNVSTNASVR